MEKIDRSWVYKGVLFLPGKEEDRLIFRYHMSGYESLTYDSLVPELSGTRVFSVILPDYSWGKFLVDSFDREFVRGWFISAEKEFCTTRAYIELE